MLTPMATDPSKVATVERTASSRAASTWGPDSSNDRLIIDGMTFASVVISAGNDRLPEAIRSEKLSTSPLSTAVT